MSPKRTPVKASQSEPKRQPVKKKKPAKYPPQKKSEVFDTVPMAATPERIETVAQQPLIQRKDAKVHGDAPEKPEDTSTREGKAALHRYLRYCAGMYYTTDLRGCTILQLSKHPMFKIVPIDTLGRWAGEDRWVDRRQINLEQWRKAIEHKIGSELVRARKTGLEKLQTIFDKLFKKLDGDIVKANSYEGLVSAMVKLADLMDNWNDKIAKAVIPDMPSAVSVAGPAEQTRPKLTQREARESARLILKIRRDGMRDQSAREQAEAAGKTRPDLEVIEGE